MMYIEELSIFLTVIYFMSPLIGLLTAVSILDLLYK